MIKKWTVTYPAYTGEEERNAYVYLPVGYNRNRKVSYPVLYMFDGHNLFFDEDATYGKSWGLAEYLDRHRIPLIVASVECHHGPGGRLSEYTPFRFDDWDGTHIRARGAQTMNWYIKVFKKYIDSTYRTLPDRKHTFIGGSSLGGLMTLYALMRHNRVFSRGAALSPSTEVDIDSLCALIEGAKIKPDTVLYMDFGAEEFAAYEDAEKDYRRLSDTLFDKNVLMTNRIIPDGTHCEASWEKQIPFFINTLLYE